MRTEAEQLEINPKRLEAELYRLQVTQNQQSQNEKIAQIVGAAMQQNEQNQPHVTYHVYKGGWYTA